MKSVYAFLLVICAIYVATTLASSSNIQEYRKHFVRVLQFRCKDPQMRSISIASLHNIGSQQVFHPAVTVLHRCDAASGCCPQSERLVCGPVGMEEVSLVFSVMNVIDENANGNSRRKNQNVGYITVIATNHTECGCQDIYDLPK